MPELVWTECGQHEVTVLDLGYETRKGFEKDTSPTRAYGLSSGVHQSVPTV
jgi:hypothetical protein